MAWRYLCILWLKGKRDVVAPTSAPMLQMVAIPGEGEGRKKRERWRKERREVGRDKGEKKGERE